MLNHIAGYTPNAYTFDIHSVDPDSFSDGINVPNLMLAHNICNAGGCNLSRSLKALNRMPAFGRDAEGAKTGMH